MTDLQIIDLCAQSLGYKTRWPTPEHLVIMDIGEIYNPLINDGQAMALVKKSGLTIIRWSTGWQCYTHDHTDCAATNSDLNRAICECVAKMQRAKAAR